VADEEWLAGLNRPTIVFVGRAADPRKNLPLLLDAFRILRARMPDVRLRLIGEKPLMTLPDGAEATGPVPDVASELARGTVFVLPSFQEGFGIVVAEALAAGLPVVVSPCGGPEELVRASKGGVVLDGFTTEELATTLESLLNDGDRLLTARTSGRTYVEREHSPARFREILGPAIEQLDAQGSTANR
jgi:glycosyltransferase involved in cell wall biosynthesis